MKRERRIAWICLIYAVFTGIGIAGTTVLGIALLGESVSVAKIISLLVLITGIIGLKFCEGESEEGNDGKSGDAAADGGKGAETDVLDGKECDAR